MMTDNPLSKIRNLVPASLQGLARWNKAWKQSQLERERAMREAVQRAENMRRIPLL